MMMTVKSLSALALSHQGPIAGEKKRSPQKMLLHSSSAHLSSFSR